MVYYLSGLSPGLVLLNGGIVLTSCDRFVSICIDNQRRYFVSCRTIPQFGEVVLENHNVVSVFRPLLLLCLFGVLFMFVCHLSAISCGRLLLILGFQ